MRIMEALYTSAEALALPRLLARNSAYGSAEGSLPRASLNHWAEFKEQKLRATGVAIVML